MLTIVTITNDTRGNNFWTDHFHMLITARLQNETATVVKSQKHQKHTKIDVLHTFI